MNMNDLHRRLLRDVLEVGNDLLLVITGGYAVQAHGIVDRMSRDIDVATNSSIPMEILASGLIEGDEDELLLGTAPDPSTLWKSFSSGGLFGMSQCAISRQTGLAVAR